jgi:hypothetical protein
MVVLPNSDYQLGDLSGAFSTNRQTACMHVHPLESGTKKTFSHTSPCQGLAVCDSCAHTYTRGVDLFQKMFAIVGFYLHITFAHLHP